MRIIELENRDEAKRRGRSWLNFFNKSFKKKRRKHQVKQQNKTVWVKPWLKNRADSSAYNNFLHLQFLDRN